MNWDKFVYKTKFRLLKIPSFFKLMYYNFLKKHNLEGDDAFYYHCKRKNLRAILRTSAEHDYLEYHGLLPEQEPEQEPETETPEQEPGLIRTLTFLDMVARAINLNGSVYLATEVKEYEDRVCIAFEITDTATDTSREETVCAPHETDQNYDRFSLDGLEWRWDRGDSMLRPCPQCKAPAEVTAEENGVQVLDGLILRVEKSVAEERLSPLCLEYAFASGADGYDWCICDHSSYPVFHELNLVPDGQPRDFTARLSFYCPRYFSRRIGN